MIIPALISMIIDNEGIVGDGGGFQVLRFSDSYLQTQRGKALLAEALAQ